MVAVGRTSITRSGFPNWRGKSCQCHSKPHTTVWMKTTQCSPKTKVKYAAAQANVISIDRYNSTHISENISISDFFLHEKTVEKQLIKKINLI